MAERAIIKFYNFFIASGLLRIAFFPAFFYICNSATLHEFVALYFFYSFIKQKL
jgi:hypothetical protein